MHANDADVFLTFKARAVGVKVLRITPFDDIEAAVGAKVAEGRGDPRPAPVTSSFSVDGVFVDAEDGRADAVRAFPCFALGIFVVEPFDGSRAQSFALGEDATGDP